MKKCISALLALLFLFAGCKEAIVPDETPTVEPTAPVVTEEPAVTTPAEEEPELPTPTQTPTSTPMEIEPTSNVPPDDPLASQKIVEWAGDDSLLTAVDDFVRARETVATKVTIHGENAYEIIYNSPLFCNVDDNIKQIELERVKGFNDYFKSWQPKLSSFRVEYEISTFDIIDDNSCAVNIYEWTWIDSIWDNGDDFLSGFGERHILYFIKEHDSFVLKGHVYDEHDVSGINTIEQWLWLTELPSSKIYTGPTSAGGS